MLCTALCLMAAGRESWIEIASNPSASSLSSVGDEVVTTGLRVQQGTARHRRTVRSTAPTNLQAMSRPQSMGGSSQDEYEESESESEKLMSSNEGLHLPLAPAPPPYSSSEDGASEAVSDEDEISTAINYRPSDTCFTPQPNAFSHPPSGPTARNPQSVPGSYFPATSRPTNRNAVQRHSYSHPRQPQQHSPFNAISPAHHVDHDAALRASLSTLLSCAAAARGLPKSSSSRTMPPTATAAPSINRIDPTSLRMVPESIALGPSPDPASSPGEPPFNPTLQRPSSPSRTTSSDSRDSAAAAASKPSSKRKAAAAGTTGAATTGRSTSKDRHATKKARRTAAHHPHWASPSAASDSLADVSPTLLTWVVSAGVVVLVSALSFGAGFALGRETGRAEVMGGARWTGELGGGGAEGVLRGCGRESGAGSWGWRERLGWGTGVGGVMA
ncbi:MAG: hypothetical protein M1821_007176 [Bathelium mastoideum]|nr:MAG: hypothetical protein M1821_007176 [Bathelium mastoideum]